MIRFFLFVWGLLWVSVMMAIPVHATQKKVVIEHADGCNIKGNLSSQKRKIYHMPGSHSYKRTKINKKGEHWFCTEKQAQDAGWRRAGKFKRPVRDKKDCALPKGKQATDPLIKGNITRRGKMYHLPCSDFYHETLIIEQEGEKWFRTEEEALTAGWFKAGKLWARPPPHNFADCIVPKNAPPGRNVKGNISRNGLIYHVVGSKYYAETSITVKTGERWFASGDEAKIAGWRAPKNAGADPKDFCATQTLVRLKMRGSLTSETGE